MASIDVNTIAAFGTAAIVLYTYLRQQKDAAQATASRKAMVVQVAENTEITNQTHDLVNGRYSALVEELRLVKLLLAKHHPDDSILKAEAAKANDDVAVDIKVVSDAAKIEAERKS